MRTTKLFTMKKIFTLLLLLTVFTAGAQQFNNEWIRYQQTYYKFKVGSTGVFRIPKSVLDAAGIGNTQVQFFELWRNGQQVPFYPSVSSGVLPANGFIEFWGRTNDGKPDNPMYRDPAYQHTAASSLVTDSSTYFLSVNTNQSGFMIFDGSNDVSSNTLPLEPYFMYTRGYYPKVRMNQGFAAVVGEYVYSSSYDKGEYWSSTGVLRTNPVLVTETDMRVYAAGPASSLRFGGSGLALNPRSVKVSVNNTVIKDTVMDYFNDIHTAVPISTSLIAAGSANVLFENTSTVPGDRYVVSYYELTYPRTFDFGGKTNFEFKLPADDDGYYIEITNFNYGSVAPVLYDLSFGTRYVGDISTPGRVKFVLPASTSETNYVLVNEEAGNATTVNSLTTRNFVKFSDAAFQGNFLIISDPLLNIGTNGRKPLDEYASYRSSVNGGSYNVKIYDVNELEDQFAFGLNKHPLSVRNFIRYARAKFSQPLKNIFLVGRGMTYNEYRVNQSDPLTEQLNLVPTFGSPASDNLLASNDVTSPVPATPIGRLSVINGKEVEDYLEKLIEYETAQRTAPNTIAGRDWMKNVVHVTGASDPYLGVVLCNYMGVYKQMIEDTLFGAKVSTFCKASANPVEQLTTERISQLFAEGISILTYFGHSSSTTLEFNLDNPQAYNNQGKYPVFFVNGCNAGNFFTYYPQRLLTNETLSEKFVLAKQRGSVAFMASTHYGIVNYLNIYLNNLYNTIGKKDYAAPLGEINQLALQALVDATGPYDYYARMHAEEITLHGDPAIRLNVQPKPDYVIEEQLIKIDPAFISVAQDSFQLKIKVVNLGKAIGDSVLLKVERRYPDGVTGTIFSTKLRGIHYADSLLLDVPIIGTRDKGINRIIATIDADSKIDEIAENNNSAVKEFFVYEDEARPVFPYNYAIVNNATQKLIVSTANPFSTPKDFILEVDTTEKFNSSLKYTKTQSSSGGLIEFAPAMTYLDSTVYYWRVALVPAQGEQPRWNESSFIYISNSSEGFNQSHYYQKMKSTYDRVYLDSVTRKLDFGKRVNNVFVRNGVFPTAANTANDISITVNGLTDISSVCGISNLIFCVFDPVTFKPWFNALPGDPPKYNSDPVCGTGRRFNFQYYSLDTAKRRSMVEFLDLVPDGYYVIVRNVSGTAMASNSYASTWMGDTSYLGHNNSIYHRFLEQGFTTIDSFNRPRAFIFAYQKNRQSQFTPRMIFSEGPNDRINLPVDFLTPDSLGYVTSPKFGPAKSWQEVVWRGHTLENPSDDHPTVDVIGIDADNNESLLFTLDKDQQNFDISIVSAQQFPYMRLHLRNVDSTRLTPYQLDYWRINYVPVPEGAIATNLFFTSKDTLEIGEKLQFGVAFKNISKTAFDSVKVKLMVIGNDNVQHFIDLPKVKPIVAGDTATIRFAIDTKDFPEHNIAYLDVNPDNDQLEQYHFNNFLYRNFYVRVDKTKPVLDVTFDGVHILNRDIVSAKPHIVIKLKDEAKYMLLNDTSLTTVQVKFPNGEIRSYAFNTDTLRFTPATSGAENTASIDFFPQFLSQSGNEGEEYELIVKGKDRSGNKSGEIEYRITFKIISKPMISNLLNYPNPFSTSTAFVFTITGSEIPQNMKIQILTVTGKIVREITKDELGPLHIGRNITEYKWDGTDQFGQKLANGVYLYRVVTTLNGKSMEKYKAEGDNTDKYFNNGYGKMYLMR